MCYTGVVNALLPTRAREQRLRCATNPMWHISYLVSTKHKLAQTSEKQIVAMEMG